MKNKIIGALIALALAFPQILSAQEWYIPRYITADVGGGLHTIQFNPRDGEHKVGAGFRINAGCVFMIDNNWGVSTSVGLSSFASKVLFNQTMESSFGYDSTISVLNPGIDQSYEFRTYYTDLTEKQSLINVSIPIMAYYQFPINSNMNIIGRAGFQIGVPVISKYKLVEGVIETRKLMKATGVEMADTTGLMAHHGIFRKEVDGQKGNTKVNAVNVSLALEAGASYKLTRTLSAYASLYFGYCLTNIYKESLKRLVQPTNSEKFEYSGTLRSNQIDRASLLSVGLSAGVVWEFRAAYVRTKPKF